VGVFTSLRHFLLTIHGWTAILFLIAIAVHLLLHRTYIKANLRSREKARKNQTG
jgi:purine-cytosine permease-like protein